MKNKSALLFVKKLFVVLILLSIARATFVVCNWHHFSDEKFNDILFAYVLGIRTDISLLFLINIPVVALIFLYDILGKKIIYTLSNVLFFVINFVAIALNFVDCAYFKFIYRRSGYELLSVGMFADEDMSVFGHIIYDFWYIILLCLLAGYWLFKATFKRDTKEVSCEHDDSADCKQQSKFVLLLKLFITAAIFVFCIRGGWQSKPLKPIDTNAIAKTIKTSVIANNTMFNVIHTRKKLFKNCTHFMPNDQAREIFPIVHKNISKYHGKFKGKNVFIIILEGFSAEHCGFLDKKYKQMPDLSYTPFLDELSKKCMVFDGFSNGVSSIDAITSIVLDIPPFTNTSFVTSAYIDNDMKCGPKIFRDSGYSTIFFYGGQRNSCRFDAVRKKSEIEKYYCQDEYDGDKSDLNPWGINDEEFLQFALAKVSESSKPFFATLFTLSTHHPFVMPEKYKETFPKGVHPIMELIGYSDNALRKFFENAEKQNWYQDTVFVFVADHINGAVQPFYQNSIGRHSIPMMIFDPSGELSGDMSHVVMQHVDIMPTLLDICGFDEECFMVGTSVFDDKSPRFAISVSNNIYQLIKDGYVLRFDGEKSIGLYDKEDYLLKNNLINKEEFSEKLSEMETFLEAFLQQFGDSVVNNKMTADRLIKK